VFDEDNPEEAKGEQPNVLLSLYKVNEGKKNIIKHKTLKKK
jgi:hypothetical protein